VAPGFVEILEVGVADESNVVEETDSSSPARILLILCLVCCALQIGKLSNFKESHDMVSNFRGIILKLGGS